MNGNTMLAEQSNAKLSEIYYQEMFSHTLTLGNSVKNRQSKVTTSLISNLMPIKTSGMILLTPHTSFAKDVYEYALSEKEKGNINNKNICFIDCSKQNNVYIDLLKGDVEESVKNIRIVIDNIVPLRINTYFDAVNDTALRFAITIMKQIKGSATTIEDLYQLLNNYNYANIIIEKASDKFISNDSESFKIAVEWLKNNYWGNELNNLISISNQLEYIVMDETLSNFLNATGKDIENKTEFNFKDYVPNKSILLISTSNISNEVTSNILMSIILNQLANYYMSVKSRKRVESLLFIEDFSNLFINKNFFYLFHQIINYKVSINLSVRELNLSNDELKCILDCTSNKFLMKDMNQGIINQLHSYKGTVVNKYHIEDNGSIWKINDLEKIQSYLSSQNHIGNANEYIESLLEADQDRTNNIKEILKESAQVESKFPGLLDNIEPKKDKVLRNKINKIIKFKI